MSESEIYLGRFQTRVFEYLIEKKEAFSTFVVLLINISAKCFAETMGGEVVAFDAVLLLDAFDFAVDVLDGKWLSGSLGKEDELIGFWFPDCFIEFIHLFLDRGAEGNLSGLAGLYFSHRMVTPVDDILPAKMKYIGSSASGAECQACVYLHRIIFVFMKPIKKSLILFVWDWICGG